MKKGLMKKIIATAVLGIMTMGLAGCGSSNDKNSASKTDLLEKIQKNGKLVVGMSADYAPYEFHYIDENGKMIEPEEPNAYKFEYFIFDSFEFFNQISIVRGKREEDFAPVKNKEGVDSPATASKLYNDYWRKQNGRM